MKFENKKIRSMQLVAKANTPATAVWLESKETPDATTQLRECMMRKFMESRSRPEIRTIEQTIVCLQELEKCGKLTAKQKAELDSLLCEHAQMIMQPQRSFEVVTAA